MVSRYYLSPASLAALMAISAQRRQALATKRLQRAAVERSFGRPWGAK